MQGKIYFIADEHNRVKIGFTSGRMFLRLKGIQISNADLLTILFIQSGTTGDEARLQKRFQHLQVRGEWFKLTDEIREYIGEPSEAKELMTVEDCNTDSESVDRRSLVVSLIVHFWDNLSGYTVNHDHLSRRPYAWMIAEWLNGFHRHFKDGMPIQRKEVVNILHSATAQRFLYVDISEQEAYVNGVRNEKTNVASG